MPSWLGVSDAAGLESDGDGFLWRTRLHAGLFLVRLRTVVCLFFRMLRARLILIATTANGWK
jgi:hypothetical protein